MSLGKAQLPKVEPAPSLSLADPVLEKLRPRLAAATKEELVALTERLASDSEALAARIDYLTDPSAAAQLVQQRISTIRRGKRYVPYSDVPQLAAEIATIAADIRTDVLPRDAEKAVAIAGKLFCLDQVIFERADDSGGSIGYELRAACGRGATDRRTVWRARRPQLRHTDRAGEDGGRERPPIGRRPDVAGPHRGHSRPRLCQGVWTRRALPS